MTLLTDTPAPAAGGQPPATPPPAAPPSSGEAAPKTGEQVATGKEPAPPAKPTVEVKGKEESKDGGVKPSGAPETYTLKAPEGHVLGDKATTALSEVARELNLTNDAAQKLVDKMAPALQAQTQANIKSMVDGWAEESMKHPVIGGNKLQEHVALANRALALAPPELRQLLGPVSDGGTGLGNHPAVIAGLAAIGRKLSPDTKVVSGTPPAPPPKSAEERLAESYANR